MRSRWKLFHFVGLILLLTSLVIGCAESNTKEDLDAAYDEGYSKGYAAGRDDGYKIGLAEGESTNKEAVDASYDRGHKAGYEAGLARTSEQSHQQHFEQGNIYLEQEQWDEAITEFSKAIKLNPELEVAARIGRGKANAWAGYFEQALDDFEEAFYIDYYNTEIQFYGGSWGNLMNADAYVAWGIAATAQRSSPFGGDAEDLFNDAISRDPNNSDAYTGRALRYLKKAYGDIIKVESIGFSHLGRAISDFEKAIELDPEGIQGRIKRFNFEGDMAFLPNYIEANKRRGAVLITTDLYVAKGFEEYDRVLDIYPEDVEALVGRGIAYMRLQQYDLALLDFGKAIELAPGNAHAYAGRAIAYSKQNNHSAASRDFEKAIKSDNGYEKGQYYAAYMTSSYYGDENPISYGKAFVRTYRSLGDEYSKNKRYDLAITSYTLAINMDYDHFLPYVDERTFAFWGRAKAYSKVEEYDKAITDFKNAASDSGNEIFYKLGAEYFVPLAVVYWKVGNYGAASAAFSEADSFMNFEDFMDAESYLAMGVVRYHAEDKWGFKIWGYRAVEYALNKAIELAPGSSIATEAQQYLNKLRQNRDAFP